MHPVAVYCLQWALKHLFLKYAVVIQKMVYSFQILMRLNYTDLLYPSDNPLDKQQPVVPDAPVYHIWDTVWNRKVPQYPRRPVQLPLFLFLLFLILLFLFLLFLFLFLLFLFLFSLFPLLLLTLFLFLLFLLSLYSSLLLPSPPFPVLV